MAAGALGLVLTGLAVGLAGAALLRHTSKMPRLWTSDGTPEGTPGASLAVVGERLFFPAYAPESGTELWALSPE